jgi:signal transduction histidine kinase
VHIEISANRETADEGSDVVITVTDNGPGIPEDIIEKIFDPYYSTKTGVQDLALLYATQLLHSMKVKYRQVQKQDRGHPL